MILDNGLWPHPVPRPSGEYNQHDNEDLFKRNLKKIGSTWHYAKKFVYYQNNSLGYRTKELDYYKDKDFILVLGCSHTEGIGQSEDETWHYHISKKFNVEILNAGFCASGPDMQMLNSFLFLENSKLKPKAVIIQWPHLSRVMFKGDLLKRLLLPNFNVGLNYKSLDKEYLDTFKKQQKMLDTFYKSWLYDYNSINQSSIFIETTRLMWNLANIPYYDFILCENDSNLKLDNLKDKIKLKEIDFGRDLSHFGPKFNKEIGKLVANKLRKIL